MSNEVLHTFLKEYEQKKLKAEIDLEKRKESLYQKIPRLEQIEDELNRFAILTAKNILLHGDFSLEDLNKKVEKLKYEKTCILHDAALPSDYLQPHYECPTCKDTGYIKKDNYQTQMCNCLKQKLLDFSFHKSNMAHLGKENFANFNETIFSDEIDVSKYHFNISPRQNIRNIKQKCLNFIQTFDDPNVKNLLFSGNTGLGKTYMSNCIAQELLKVGKTVLYQTAPVLLESVIDYKMSKQKNVKDNIYQSVLRVDLLIIDDLGTESLNSMKLSELFTILNTRILNLNHKVTKTIISTNLNIKDLFTNYEERIGSRIAGYYDIYCFFGDDLRLKPRIRDIS